MMIAGLIAAQPAQAQNDTRACVNQSLRINVPAQSMSAALAALSRQTHCPISQPTDVSRLRSNRVVGTFTAVEALKTMVRGTGIKGRSIKQRLTVVGGRRATAATTPAPTPYDCQNASRRINIGRMPMDRALAMLSQQTRCPISHDFEVGELLSRPVRSTYTPLLARPCGLERSSLAPYADTPGFGERKPANSFTYVFRMEIDSPWRHGRGMSPQRRPATRNDSVSDDELPFPGLTRRSLGGLGTAALLAPGVAAAQRMAGPERYRPRVTMPRPRGS